MSEKTRSTISRRSFLKGAAAGAAIISSPAFVRNAFASSGELNLYSWSDYIYQDMLDAFTKETGIKVNLSVYGSNDEVLNKLRASKGKGFDIVMPSVTYGVQWAKYNLLQPLNEKKINADGCIPSMWKDSERLGAVMRRKRYTVPFNWGTEGVCFDTSAHSYQYGKLSYGDIWAPENAGKMTIRAHSGLIGLGLWMDAAGKISSNQMRDTYVSEEKMRKIYTQVTDYAIKMKKNIRAFWSNAQETTNAFMQNGCVIGQTWDGPAMRLRTETKSKITYMAPKEGALTWMDSMGIPSGAQNVEQAYAFINWYYKPQNGAMHANNSGYNSCTKGAENYLNEDSKKNFAAAYPGNAIANLWWYPIEPAWFVSIRNEYRDKLLAS